MQRRVTSRGDIVIDKWSKLAETSKHWQVCWWPPRIRSRDSASFYLVTAMPCIILQVSGVVSDILYTTWGFLIWNKYHMGSWAWLSDLYQPDRVTGSVLRPSLKPFSGINFHIVHNCDKNADCCFSNTGHYYINSSDCGMFLYYWHSMTSAAMKQMSITYINRTHQ